VALNIKIDFENRYDVFPINNANHREFETELINDKKMRLSIMISPDEHPLMRDVYNNNFVTI
jgi:hypothetical protein